MSSERSHFAFRVDDVQPHLPVNGQEGLIHFDFLSRRMGAFMSQQDNTVKRGYLTPGILPSSALCILF